MVPQPTQTGPSAGSWHFQQGVRTRTPDGPVYKENDSPQEHERFAFGFTNLKPVSISDTE